MPSFKYELLEIVSKVNAGVEDRDGNHAENNDHKEGDGNHAVSRHLHLHGTLWLLAIGT